MHRASYPSDLSDGEWANIEPLIPGRKAKTSKREILNEFPFIELIWADGGYAGKLVEWTKDFCAIALCIVKRGTEKGFQVLPRRWVVECTFG